MNQNANEERQTLVAYKTYNLAAGVDSLIGALTPEDRERILERLSSNSYQQELALFIGHMTQAMVQIVAVDNVSDELFLHARTQTSAVASYMQRLAQHGESYGKGLHKIEFAHVYPEKPADKESTSDSVDNAPKSEKSKPGKPDPATL